MSAEPIARVLGEAQMSGDWWRCRCPVHGSTGATLTLRDGLNGLIAHCHAGCSRDEVLAEIARRGLIDSDQGRVEIDPAQIERQRADDERRRKQRTAAAMDFWRHETADPQNTAVGQYWLSRGLALPLPPPIRASRSWLRHPEGGTRPAMVALVEHVDLDPVAIHRTYLAIDGSGKASFRSPRLSLGPVGGAAVRLADVGDTLVVAEGIETAASVMLATGLPAWAALSAGGIERLVLLPLPIAAIVIIAADNDRNRVGERAARAAAERWLREGRRVRIAMPPVPGTDFNDLIQRINIGDSMPHSGFEGINKAIKNAEEITEPGVREFPVMADEAYIGLPGDIVRMVEPHTESDPTGLLLSTLTMFGNCVGRGPHYRVEATEHGPNLYVVKVGDSSKARKGTGEDRILSFFRQVDEEWVGHCVHTGLSSGEGVIWAVRDAIVRIVKDKKTDQLVEETIDFGVNDKRLMVIESEFAGALRVMQREGNILSRILRDGWDRGNLATLTKHSPARATGACVSIVGHITATELRTYFDRTEMANGFGNRFMYACVRRSKFLPFGGALILGDVLARAYQIRRAVETARSIRQVVMSPAAAEAWGAIYPDLSADRPGLLGSITARAEAQVVRLAMLYALWAGSDRIDLDHLTAAVAIEEFSRKSAEYVFGDMLGDQVADTILDALRSAGPRGLTRTEISNLFARNTSSSQIARALGELARRGLAAQRKTDGAGTAGRPAEVWATIDRRVAA